jgi:cardiolipin synthase
MAWNNSNLKLKLKKNLSLGYFIGEWLIRLAMLFYVPQKRSTASARSWLLFIFLFPYPGLLIYWLIGRIFLSKRRIALQERMLKTIREEQQKRLEQFAQLPRFKLKPEYSQSARLAQELGGFAPLGGNQLELLVGYCETIDRLIEDIEQARHHVHLLFYIFADDSTGSRIIEALGRASHRGVKCRVLVDSFGSKRWLKGLRAKLKAAGVEFHLVLQGRTLLRQSAARFDLRNHRKIAVIDGRIGYTGSQNLVDADFKKGITYEELMVRVSGPVVMQLQAVFLADYFYETLRTLTEPELLPVPHITGETPAQVLPDGPGDRFATTHRFLVDLIYSAQTRLVLTTPYFVPDEPLLQALVTAARCGVEVHLVVSYVADQFLVSQAQRSFYEELLEAGVKIHLYLRNFLHAKHVTVDDYIALVGSSNIDIRSFVLNAEVSLLIYDQPVVARLRQLEERYFEYSHNLTLAECQ